MQVSTTIQNWMPRNTITLSMRLETNVNLGKKESKIRSAPNSENKIKIGVRSVHHPHPHPPLLGSSEHLVEVLYLLAQAYFITIQYITVLQHYNITIYIRTVISLFKMLLYSNTTIFWNSFFYPSDLPHRAHLFQAVLLSLSKCCLPCGKNISFKRMRFVQRNVCLNTHAYCSFYEENT